MRTKNNQNSKNHPNLKSPWDELSEHVIKYFLRFVVQKIEDKLFLLQNINWVE